MLSAGSMLSGCLTGAGGTPSGRNSSGSKTQLQFWHTRRRQQEKVLQAICAEYEKSNPGVQVQPKFQGNYDQLNTNVRAAIQANSLPALSVAYESHVTEYMSKGAVRALDDLVKDPEIGFTQQELEDIPEQYLASNRFRQFGNQLLSFPFTKSNLVLYYNRALIRKAGFSAPPETWPAFERQAAAVTKLIGKPAYAFSVDASTVDGLIYSHGGRILADDGIHTLFDQPPTVRMLELLQRMARARTLAVTDPDRTAALFANQGCAFATDSSSSRAYTEDLVQDKFDWDLAVIPHADGVDPVTVMYGPNVCIFKATPEQEREAWKFAKYFVSPEVTARWARETGYLPVRRSAVELPEMKEFYAKNPRALHVYEALSVAKGEPNVIGWQEVRDLLEDAARKVVTAGTAPRAAAVDLKRKADQTLAQSK
jgi:multiple sugar transport system substrate-binding protein